MNIAAIRMRPGAAIVKTGVALFRHGMESGRADSVGLGQTVGNQCPGR